MAACYVKSCTHTDVYHNTTLIYQDQNVLSRCTTADISELWSVKVEWVCAALKAGPPVQTLFPLLPFDVVCQKPKHRALLWPLYQLPEAAVCLRVERPGCNKRLRSQQQILWQGDGEKQYLSLKHRPIHWVFVINTHTWSHAHTNKWLWLWY